MVGIFGRFPGTKTSHPSQRSADENEKSVPSKEVVSSAHGVQLSSEFHPVEHPQEPPDKDRPVRCPQPEPCILHDGRIWKERLQASTQRSSELPVIREAGVQLQGSHRRRYTVSSERLIAPSFSAPEHAILKLLE